MLLKNGVTGQLNKLELDLRKHRMQLRSRSYSPCLPLHSGSRIRQLAGYEPLEEFSLRMV